MGLAGRAHRARARRFCVTPLAGIKRPALHLERAVQLPTIAARLPCTPLDSPFCLNFKSYHSYLSQSSYLCSKTHALLLLLLKPLAALRAFAQCARSRLTSTRLVVIDLAVASLLVYHCVPLGHAVVHDRCLTTAVVFHLGPLRRATVYLINKALF